MDNIKTFGLRVYSEAELSYIVGFILDLRRFVNLLQNERNMCKTREFL